MIDSSFIAVALGRPIAQVNEDTLAQWDLWISDALMLIEARLGDPAGLDQGRLDYVVRSAVAAMAKRPDDATQVEVAVDDGRVSRTYQSSEGRVVILPEWWALLEPGDTGPRGAFSVRPGFEPC